MDFKEVNELIKLLEKFRNYTYEKDDVDWTINACRNAIGHAKHKGEKKLKEI